MRLKEIKTPASIKRLCIEELKDLAQEIREVIIKQVSLTGGHLASNLGVIELTLALHYVFNSPIDKIIWDVGHQSYPHKLLTGRLDRFPTLRQHGGLSGFPKREESQHDPYGTGHSSTSISAALGIVEGRERLGRVFKVIAVIGDGAMTGGLAFEGLNHAGHLKKDIIVVLNDNEMSISKNVGALSSYLTRIMTCNIYKKFKKETKSFIEFIPKVGEHVSRIAQKTEDTLKYFILPGMLFEELGFTYIGPIDGHDIGKLIDAFECIKDSTGPTLVHVITRKGKGYEFSERYPCTFHGVGPFEPDTGQSKKCQAPPSFSELFGQAMVELAEVDPRVIAITAAMTEGTGLETFAKRFPERFYDVGIAEPHAATFAAGLSVQGLRPVVAVYSTFLQRAYDEIVHDVCLQKLPVIFAIDRAGIVGEDGPTHQGLFDISYLRHVPNLSIMAPKNGFELTAMLKLAINQGLPAAVRFSRDSVGEDMEEFCLPVQYGKAEVIMEGKDIAFLAVGQCVLSAFLAAKTLRAEGIEPEVVNMRFIKPLDHEFLVSLFKRIKCVITVEENVVAGGFGSALLEYLNSAGITDVTVKIIGIPDVFVEHGRQDILRHIYELDANGICKAATTLLKQRQNV
ncbi:1-deoxy-D-xylulose-5-phosphate synthase [Candidatus Magnetobacterium casense]|uniref:1-deoxy-D-xylulose-5-phosphate synthase n=1 Tax=Candidatus Magnetobacterium casense TaxID=1455061 RepID=A0ABS6RXJ0_9BACT|nr:1-deoxy-D-xylulose-5-phosphate synthase [Candidatus Magnetobacterium casensis]MBV6341291.1 1-deoxy-D-xylulose-5-phosphate synthase [Candidatus Magnetobacterium casensis]